MSTRARELRWVHEPKQKRSQETLDRLLDAIERIFAEGGGLEDVSIAEIARRAEVSVGAFYARFKHREAALYALHERFAVEAKRTADDALVPARWQGVPMGEIARAVATFLVDEYAARPGLRRAVLLLNASDERARARSKEVSGYVAARIHGLLAARSDEITHPDLMLAADVIHRMLFAMNDQWVVFLDGASTGRPLEREVWVCELTRMICAYLGCPLPRALAGVTSS